MKKKLKDLCLTDDDISKLLLRKLFNRFNEATEEHTPETKLLWAAMTLIPMPAKRGVREIMDDYTEKQLLKEARRKIVANHKQHNIPLPKGNLKFLVE